MTAVGFALTALAVAHALLRELRGGLPHPLEVLLWFTCLLVGTGLMATGVTVYLWSAMP